MYKLVTVGGKLRGQEFVLQEGENSLGRDAENTIQIAVEGVSKRHLRITVNGDTAFLEDLGSSNGTFLNDNLIKSATIKDGDRIALPNVIFQMVYVREKKIIIKKKIYKEQKESEQEINEAIPPMPASPLGKLIHLFKYRFMVVIYTLNREYEWRSIIAISLSIFIAIITFLTIAPVLQANRAILLSEIGARGFHYAQLIGQLNAVHLARKNFDSIDCKFLDSEPGVESYELFDLDGRIVRPLGKFNEYITDPYSIEAKENAIAGKEKSSKNLGDGRYGISMPIMAYNAKRGYEEAVGVIAIKFAPRSLVLEASNNSKAYLEAFTTSILVGILFFGLIYYLTIRHVEDLRFQVDQVMRGKQKEVEGRFAFLELAHLRSTLNTLLQKYLEASGTAAEEFAEVEDDAKYVVMLKEFLKGTPGPAVIMNSEKSIMSINPEAEDITGIRESVGINMNLLDVARDQGFAATVIDLCDQVANNHGLCQQGSYELQGSDYNIFVNGLVGKDNFVKAFLITFKKES